MDIHQSIEERISSLPLLQYAFIRPGELVFSERVRYICEHECGRYGTSWACPPAVGSVEECKRRALGYDEAFVFATVSEVPAGASFEELLEKRKGHEEAAGKIKGILEELGMETLMLSTESCAICESCAYPGAPCRHPDRMFPCVESFGILATALAERCGIEFMYGDGVVTWFGLALFRKKQ